MDQSVEFVASPVGILSEYGILECFEGMVNQIRHVHEGRNKGEAITMHIVMTSHMWMGVSRCFAEDGGTCSNIRINVNADKAKERLEMFEERMALPINGRWYPVEIDNMIPETTGQINGICSDIYFITNESE